MSIRFRTAVVSGVALVVLWGGYSPAQEPNLPSAGDSSAAIEPTEVLSELPPPANGDVQYEFGDEPLAAGGPEFVITPSAEAIEPNLDGYVVLGDQPPQVEGGTSVTGSLDSGGVMFNGSHPRSHFNGPVTFADRDEGQLDQLYMVGGIGGTEDGGWFGLLRCDLMFGSNYYFMTAAGLDGTDDGNRGKWYVEDRYRYGWAMPQLYVETGYDDLHVKFGHFFSPIGYEEAQADKNFFITRSYAFQYGEPITQTGLLVSNSIDDNWSWSSGAVGGWNTFEANTRAAYVGGLTYSVEESGSAAFTLVTGDDSTSNQPGVGPFANRTMGSIVTIANLSERLSHVGQYEAGTQQDATTLQGNDRAEWYGIAQYLYYKIADCCTFGGRFEWFRDDDGFNVTGLRPGNPLVGDHFAGNFYALSLGLNYFPCETAIFRPEVRYDWFDPSNSAIGSQNPFDDNTSQRQLLYGVDLVLRY